MCCRFQANKSFDILLPELLQVAVGVRDRLSAIPSPDAWRTIYRISKEQALVGVCFAALQKLPPEQQTCSRDLLGLWFAQTEQIRQANIRQRQTLSGITAVLQEHELTACLLKGQAAALRYSADLRDLRMSGDIDVWIWQPNTSLQATILNCIRLVREHTSASPAIRYHHVEWQYEGMPIELHFRPTFMNSPFRNRRLQQWSERQKDNCSWSESWRMRIPSEDFDVVYQLAHLYRHLLDEGVGMRQVMDYYFAVRQFQGNKPALLQTLQYLGLSNFCGAMMYVLQSVFALPTQAMLVPADEWRGKVVLNQIWQDGNFGVNRQEIKVSKSDSRHFISKTRRNYRFFAYFPAEVLSEPLFRIYHFIWRKTT